MSRDSDKLTSVLCYDQINRPDCHFQDIIESHENLREKLADTMRENERLREILTECALDLKEEVSGRYTIEGRIHPAYQDRFDRDMQPVREAEALLHPNKDSDIR